MTGGNGKASEGGGNIERVQEETEKLEMMMRKVTTLRRYLATGRPGLG